MPILTKSVMVSVRFKRGTPRVIEQWAERSGRRRATWVRETVLQHADRVLGPHRTHVLKPLPDVTADGVGESLLLRFTMKECNRVRQAAAKLDMKFSTYIRAVCMQVLERREHRVESVVDVHSSLALSHPRRGASEDALPDVGGGDMNVVVVICPPQSWGRNRGFRHAVIAGQERSLCGRDVEDWMGDFETVDTVPFEQAKVGCRTCIRVYKSRNRVSS